MVTNKKGVNTQNIFLNTLRSQKIKVTIYTPNARLYGIVKGYDEFTIVLEDKDKQILVYKSGVTSIVPESPIKPIKNDSLIEK